MNIKYSSYCIPLKFEGTFTCAGIRLVGGPSSLEGRLEVFNKYESMWGAVCSEEFDDDDASAACYSLGYGFA